MLLFAALLYPLFSPSSFTNSLLSSTRKPSFADSSYELNGLDSTPGSWEGHVA